MKITLRLFASLRKRLPPGSPRGHCELELAEGTTIDAVLEQMGITQKEAQMVLVNGLQNRNLTQQLQGGDILSVFPPLAGG
jgi:molybdopterin synthase sulfur carrier subunit